MGEKDKRNNYNSDMIKRLNTASKDLEEKKGAPVDFDDM